jgi:hypothetical protein
MAGLLISVVTGRRLLMRLVAEPDEAQARERPNWRPNACLDCMGWRVELERRCGSAVDGCARSIVFPGPSGSMAA